ncbi:PEFG-CTERM sorting domain-containing protein [Nitrosopumilus sp.]|uniref:PEFG-CTERM sorting domain-containing protein n=1 Tax=Nitrosopumilus sp. TaxID=2024843 RepID=UPI002619EF95|nr:PEFG-CTERM sorting domain-containing protein [Nitrosopumilus sp.]
MFLILLSISLISSIGVPAFAESFEITMPSGASDPGAPFFWSEKSTGITTGEITVFPDDVVIWKNADMAFHTITSVTSSGELDGLFDSGFIDAGSSYQRKFSDLGDFYYFCSLHPWMSGIVHVVKNPGTVQSIHNVGSGFSENGLGFEVKYILDTNLQKAVHVSPDNQSLTFRISGTTENEQITLVLPEKLIENPNTVLVDGSMTDFESEMTSSGTKLIIPLTVDSSEIKIIGTKVIPEFGFLALGILGIGLSSALFLTRSKLSIF